MNKFSRTFHFVLIVVFFILFLFIIDGVSFGQGQAAVIVHYVEGHPLEKNFAYDVKSFLSVFDGDGEPVNGLTKDNFSLTEDSKTMEVIDVLSAKEVPLNIVFVFDTSGSMRGRAVKDLRMAGQEFVARLGDEDKISVIGFNEKISTLIDFSSDHQKVMRSINQIDAILNAGTCLYDAAYEAVQKSATLPMGRRAVILFTDGIDENFSGGLCSIHTLEDVVELASNGQTRVPIYTMGLGNKINQNNLQRLALLTGGKYLFSASPEGIGTLFADLTNQLNSEYMVSYLSNAAPGQHSLIVTVDSEQVQDQDSRKFLLPDFPINIKIMSHRDGQSVIGKQIITASFTGSGAVVDHVRFIINDTFIRVDDEYPYSIEWDFTGDSAGEQRIIVVAEDATDQLIDQEEIIVYVTMPTEELRIQPTKGEDLLMGLNENSNDETALGGGKFPFVLGGGLLLIVMVLFFVLRKKQDKTNNTLKDSSLAKLIIEASDDKKLVGKEIEIGKTRISIGRSYENDIFFSKDTPVSREHAVIEQKGQVFFLSQAITTDLKGNIKYPKYGTFVNEEKLEENSRLLKTGDEIRLGKRVRLKFVSRFNSPSNFSESATMDEIGVVTIDLENDTVDMNLPKKHNKPEEQFINTKEDLNIGDITQEDISLDDENNQEALIFESDQTMEDFYSIENRNEDTLELQFSDDETATFGFGAVKNDPEEPLTSVKKTLEKKGSILNDISYPDETFDSGKTLIDQVFPDDTLF